MTNVCEYFHLYIKYTITLKLYSVNFTIKPFFRVWQHVDCVLESRNNLPEEYLCERCSPRPFNKEAAAALQQMKLAKRMTSVTSASHLQHSSDSDLSSELGKILFL